jgi:hypothetical protein
MQRTEVFYYLAAWLGLSAMYNFGIGSMIFWGAVFWQLYMCYDDERWNCRQNEKEKMNDEG